MCAVAVGIVPQRTQNFREKYKKQAEHICPTCLPKLHFSSQIIYEVV